MDDAERIERVARALCLSDDGDPVEEVIAFRSDFLTPKHRGSGVITEFYGPRWQTYHKKARAFVAAHGN